MTPADITRITITMGEGRTPSMEDARLMLVEIDRLRMLPTLHSCGDCGYAVSAYDGPQACCTLAPVAASEMPRRTDPNDVPPSWCPLRRAR